MRVVEPVKFGEKIVVPLAMPGLLRQRDAGEIDRLKHRIEMRVTEIRPEGRTHAFYQEEEETKLRLPWSRVVRNGGQTASADASGDSLFRRRG